MCMLIRTFSRIQLSWFQLSEVFMFPEKKTTLREMERQTAVTFVIISSLIIMMMGFLSVSSLFFIVHLEDGRENKRKNNIRSWQCCQHLLEANNAYEETFFSNSKKSFSVKWKLCEISRNDESNGIKGYFLYFCWVERKQSDKSEQ